MQEFSSECPFHRQRQLAVLLFFNEINVTRRNWLGAGLSWLCIMLLWGCTSRPTDAAPPPSAPPAQLQPIDSISPVAPVVFHTKTADKRTPHKTRKTRPSVTRQAEIVAAISPAR